MGGRGLPRSPAFGTNKTVTCGRSGLQAFQGPVEVKEEAGEGVVCRV